MQNETKGHELSQTFETMRLDTCNSDDLSEDDVVEPCRKKQKLTHFGCGTSFAIEHDQDNMDTSNVTEVDISPHLPSSSSTSTATNTSFNHSPSSYTNDDHDFSDEELLCDLEVDMAAQCALLDRASLLDQVDAFFEQDSPFECFFEQAVEELRFSQSCFAQDN